MKFLFQNEIKFDEKPEFLFVSHVQKKIVAKSKKEICFFSIKEQTEVYFKTKIEENFIDFLEFNKGIIIIDKITELGAKTILKIRVFYFLRKEIKNIEVFLLKKKKLKS